MIIVALSLLGASIVTGIVVALVYLTARGKPPLLPVLARWAAGLWIFNFLLDLAILYFAMPALTGPYWGGQWLLWPLLLTGVLALFGGSFVHVRSALDSFNEQVNGGGSVFSLGPRGRRGRRPSIVEDRPEASAPANSSTAGILALVLVLVVAAGLNGVIVVATTWFDPNVKALAAIPHVVMQPATSKLPDTDVNHIVLVTSGVAAYLGQQVLASSGQNLGSLYHTDQGEYTLQSVAGHLYWLAPLVYNNVWANLGNWQSPGFVAVDAEDPNVTPVLHTNLHMRYLPDALFNQDLVRHVYLSGYTNGDLLDPTLEVDDSWTPYFTISLMQPKQGFIGEVLKQVLLVNPQSGAITAYAPDKVPAFVDRVIPSETVKTYLSWWGQYHDAPWFNPSGKNQQVPALKTDEMPELVYNKVDQPVWLVPMTSSAASDSSSTGVVLYDTRDTSGHFYPLTGLGVGTNVTTAFEASPLNIRGYSAANVQLYQIYGEPTWVATFVQDNTFGQSFQAVGMVDARHLQGVNVIMQPSKSLALAAYSQWLADNGVQTHKPIPSGTPVTLQAKVTRISAATESGSTVYYLLLQGQTRIFRAGLQLSAELPLVREGDAVSVTYLDTGQTVVTLTRFDDSNIQLATPTPTPSASPSASPTASPSASP
jgi:hypothetical protein